jgi:hypothetical protein
VVLVAGILARMTEEETSGSPANQRTPEIKSETPCLLCGFVSFFFFITQYNVVAHNTHACSPL